ncbi:DUF1345 domain-containing protein [Kineococcus arenarius]|uniref:DUF1345 domain-containing protein n=1 Tax=Kineococcus sp. SYSU DK007 TaxID=3383128 RepID=UPI003D7E5AD2
MASGIVFTIAFYALALLVVAARVSVLVTYAADYTQRQAAEPGLAFPGTTASLGDFPCSSTAVSTTFGPTDVTVTTPALRRVVTVHALVAFVFNTVVVALLVSTLIG